ncbi:hypothetical protein EDC22_101454 [Tepidamorphus gemmatus]|uniref:Uncharacterized protein n=1 Tax=Tepidamorphus gemmatus TaxID=747076 RepID=A0A4R3MJJ1_9HYPH|nr:DUF6790 family protein [Tepidamorphus gemmatus]TCT13584.1 hypothetical protein EDC22_101454 [Tepidamorphus gemmatus]
MVSFVPILAWVLALVAAAADIARAPRPLGARLVADRLLRWIFFFVIGLMSLWAFMGHVFFPAEAAAAIGWQTSPFQFEVGVANLGIGLAGVVGAFWGRLGFRTATWIVVASFLGGAAIGHLRQIAETGNLAAGNAGPILYTDILTPTVVAVLLLVAWKADQKA